MNPSALVCFGAYWERSIVAAVEDLVAIAMFRWWADQPSQTTPSSGSLRSMDGAPKRLPS